MPKREPEPDRCIYRRPFAADFNECPAFQPTTFLATDSRNQPLGVWRTCAHLTAGNEAGDRGRFYPRCALGTRAQRLQWVVASKPVRQTRLDVVPAPRPIALI
jgi:hypothetical protein